MVPWGRDTGYVRKITWFPGRDCGPPKSARIRMPMSYAKIRPNLMLGPPEWGPVVTTLGSCVNLRGFTEGVNEGSEPGGSG